MGIRFEIGDPEFLRDPYPTYAALRSESGIQAQSGLGQEFFPITRHADAVHVLRNPSLFSSKAMVLPGQEGPDTSLIGQDPPVHSRQRNIINRGFTPRRVSGLRGRIRKRVDELFGAFERRGEVELVSELAAPLPVIVIAELLGLDTSRHRDFKQWADSMIVGVSSGNEADEGFHRSLEEFREYLTGVIEARRSDPGDDLISVLIHAEEEQGVLNPTQLFNFVQLLVAAGSETTTNLLGTAVLQLATDPDLRGEIERDPKLIDALIEETLRYDSPVQMVMRRNLQPVVMAGSEIPEESLLFVFLGGANRDEATFAEPDVFDLHRNTAGLLSFGLGSHFCLGASLARLEAHIALEAVVARLPDLSLAVDEVERLGSFLVRGPRSLPLTFRVRG